MHNLDLASIITDWAEQKEQAYKGYLRASGISKCARSIGYSAQGYEALAIPGRSRIIMDDGHMHEEDIVSRLELAGIHVSNRQREIANPERTLIGHIDGDIQLDKVYLLEIKSMNHFGFKRLQEQGLKVANYEYYKQMQTYMHYGDYEAGIILVKNKNNGELYSEVILPDVYTMAEIEARVRWLIEHIQAQKLPAKEHFRDSWQCLACSYQHHCWQDSVDRINLDDVELSEAASMYKEGSQLEKRGTELVKAAKIVFEAYSDKYNNASIECNGVEVRRSDRSRESIDAALARQLLDDGVLQQITKRTKYAVLNIKVKAIELFKAV